MSLEEFEASLLLLGFTIHPAAVPPPPVTTSFYWLASDRLPVPRPEGSVLTVDVPATPSLWDTHGAMIRYVSNGFVTPQFHMEPGEQLSVPTTQARSLLDKIIEDTDRARRKFNV
jgi:hypothetical protein